MAAFGSGWRGGGQENIYPTKKETRQGRWENGLVQGQKEAVQRKIQLFLYFNKNYLTAYEYTRIPMSSGLK